MFEQIFHKRDICADTTDTEFTQGAIHPSNSLFGGWSPSRYFDQK